MSSLINSFTIMVGKYYLSIVSLFLYVNFIVLCLQFTVNLLETEALLTVGVEQTCRYTARLKIMDFSKFVELRYSRK